MHIVVRFGRVALLALLTAVAGLNLLSSALDPGQRDFYWFLASGRAIVEGGDPYASANPTLLPPFTLPVLALLAPLDPRVAAMGWWAMSLALYVAILPVLFRAYPERRSPILFAWMLAWVPLWGTLVQSQVYVVLLALVVVTWLALQRDDHRTAGIALGVLVALKPIFVPWPALLWLAGVRRPAYIAAGVAAMLYVAPPAWYGPAMLTGWLRMSTGVALGVAGNGGEMSLRGTFARLGVPDVGIVAAVLVAIALGWWAWRHRASTVEVSAVALVASLVVAPVTWTGYGVVLLPVLMHYRWTPSLWLAAVLLTVPFGVASLLGGHLYTVALVLTLAGVLAASHRPTPSAIAEASAAQAAIPAAAPQP